jgi:hypothetical protein
MGLKNQKEILQNKKFFYMNRMKKAIRSMKGFWLLGIVYFFSSTAFSQKYFNILDAPKDLPIKNGIVTYQGVIEIPGSSMTELYGFAKKFIAETYNSTDAAIDMDDTLNGVIVVKGKSYIPLKWVQRVGGKIETIKSVVLTKHVLIFEVKDNRLRFTVKDIVLDSSVTYTLLYTLTDYNIPIEFHLKKRLSFDQSKTYKGYEMAQFNFSGAYLVGTHDYYTTFSNKIEPYFKNQKLEEW